MTIEHTGRNGDHVSQSGAGGSDAQLQEISLLRAVNVILRNRKLVIGLPLAMAVFAVGSSLLSERQHEARSAFVAQAVDSRARMSGLAAQFGFSIPSGADASESPEFYRQLLSSRDLLTQAVKTEYRFAKSSEPGDTVSGTYLDIMGIEGDGEASRLRRGVEVIRGSMSTDYNYESGLVGLKTRSKWPELSILVNRRLLDLVENFNVERRQSQARAERDFVEDRLAEAYALLEGAETELAGFLEQNRRYEDSPQLIFEFGRLQQRVDLRRQVYTGLAQSYEQARIDEVRNTPVISIIDAPEGGAVPMARKTVTKGMLALVMGFIFAAILAFAREHFMKRREEQDRELLTFLDLGRQAVEEVTPHSLLVRIRRFRAADTEGGRAARVSRE